MVGYALLGVSWLVIKTDGEFQGCMRRLQLPLGAAVILLIGLVSFGTLMENEAVRERWFGLGSFIFLWIIPVVTVGLA